MTDWHDAGDGQPLSAEDWTHSVLRAPAVSHRSAFTGETGTLIPLVSCGRAVRVGWFESEADDQTRSRHVGSFLSHEVVTAEFTGEAGAIEPTEKEFAELDEMLNSARGAFAHRAYPDLPNLHAESDAAFKGLIHVRDRVARVDDRRRFSLVLGLANALANLSLTDSSQDFVIAEAISPSDSLGYVQFKGHPGGKWFFGESESRLYKEAADQPVDPEHEPMLAALRWFTEDRMANDFGLFFCETAEARFLLAEHALETLIACHSLRPGTQLSIKTVDFDTDFETTWWTEVT